MNDNIIEEEIELNKSTVSFNLILKILFDEYIDYNLDLNEKLILTKEIVEKYNLPNEFINKISINRLNNILYINDQEIKIYTHQVRLISNNINKIYNISTLNYLKKIIKENDFNDFIILSETNEQYQLEDFQNMPRNIIIKKNNDIPDYNKIYNYIKNNSNNFNIHSGNDLSYNFSYYFSQNKDSQFKFYYTRERSEFNSFIQKKKKFLAICGKYGMGKSTSILFYLKQINGCYINFKSLFKNKNNICVWKEHIFNIELLSIFKYNKDLSLFNKLLENNREIDNIWELINESIKFCIDNKIQTYFIFDQYKLEYDEMYSNIIKIKTLIESNENNTVKIILISSINDEDVRNQLLYKKNVNIKYEEILPFNYDFKAFKSLKHQKVFEKYFENVLLYYILLNNIEENEIDEFVKKEKEKIKNNLYNFLNKQNSLYSLIINRNNFGKKLTQYQFESLIQIISLKYMIVNKNDKIIDFYFPLIEEIIDEILTDEICSHIFNPQKIYTQRNIGDFLEKKFTNAIKNNKIDLKELKDVYCYELKNIWKMMKINEEIKININNLSNILLIQNDEQAEFIDLAIIENENLIFIQCKKALKGKIKIAINYNEIENQKDFFSDKIYEIFKIKIKKIFILFITGIYKKDIDEFHTWGNNKDENFDSLEKYCKLNYLYLAYFEPNLNKLFYKDWNNKYQEIINLEDFFSMFQSTINSIQIYDYNKKVNPFINEYLNQKRKLYVESVNIDYYSDETKIINYNELKDDSNLYDLDNSVIKKNINEIDLCHIDNFAIAFKIKNNKFIMEKNSKGKKIIRNIHNSEILNKDIKIDEIENNMIEIIPLKKKK